MIRPGPRAAVLSVVALALAGCAATSTSPSDEPKAASPEATEPETAEPHSSSAPSAAVVQPAAVVGPVGPMAVEIADDAAERALGLMNRPEVPDGTGMVFLYDEPVRSGFWMADVEVALSIVWVLDGTVVGVGEMEPCPAADSTCPLYLPNDPDALFDVVVETSGGTFTEAGVTVGDPVQLIDIPRPSPQ